MKYLLSLCLLLGAGFVNAQTPPNQILEISRYCAITTTKVHCWGQNEYGQSGIYKHFVNPRSIASSGSHNCLIDDEGVWCWGSNSNGQLQVPFGIKNAKKVEVSDATSCALDDEGVKCWGLNGIALTNTNLKNAFEFNLSGNSVCAIDSEGVKCWQVADQVNGFGEIIDVPNSRIKNAKKIKIKKDDDDTACALDDYGIICWGSDSGVYDYSGAVDFDINDRGLCLLTNDKKLKCAYGKVPEGIVSIRQLTSNYDEFCALHDKGLVCWSGSNGEVNNYNQPPSFTLRRKDNIYLDGSQSCALDEQKKLRCWGGYNGYVEMPEIIDPKLLSLSYGLGCAIDQANLVKCWGSSELQTNIPTTAFKNPKHLIINGNYMACVFDDDGVKCWGRSIASDASTILKNASRVSYINSYGICGVVNSIVKCDKNTAVEYKTIPKNVKKVKEFVTFYGAICVIDEENVKCWGDADQPVLKVPTLKNPRFLTGDSRHACVIDDSGLVCWGDNSKGQITIPAGLKNVTSITAKANATCVKDDGVIKCWGDNDYNQLVFPEAL